MRISQFEFYTLSIFDWIEPWLFTKLKTYFDHIVGNVCSSHHSRPQCCLEQWYLWKCLWFVQVSLRVHVKVFRWLTLAVSYPHWIWAFSGFLQRLNSVRCANGRRTLPTSRVIGYNLAPLPSHFSPRPVFLHSSSPFFFFRFLSITALLWRSPISITHLPPKPQCSI